MSVVTASKWCVSTSHTSGDPDRPYAWATIGVHRTREIPNEWGGIGVVERHPLDGITFLSADAAEAFLLAVHLTKPHIKRPLEDWIGTLPWGPDPADDDVTVRVG